MLATAELVLPSLLEDRDIAVGGRDRCSRVRPGQRGGRVLLRPADLARPGTGPEPGTPRRHRRRRQSGGVPAGLPGIATGLLLAGVFQSGVMVTRNLGLREQLPEHAHAAAYSLMYAVQGGLQPHRVPLRRGAGPGRPSVAILGGVVGTS
ncbi:hypothetical protein NKH77_09525 [Streptomyces sp. M19]